MSATTMIIELVSGLARNFPITMTGISLVGGLAVGHIAWLFMGLTAFVVIFICLAIQMIAGKTSELFPRSGDAAILQACSVVPIATNSIYYPIPSLWIALTTYFLAYILFNAIAVYNAPAKKLPQEALPVQHRKSVGVVSIATTIILFLALLIFRLRTGCEHMTPILGIPIPIGAILGVALGAGTAAGLYYAYRLGNAPLYTDVHGVMAGLQPGSLRDHPLACAPRKA
jgi:hypothetical protein